MWFIFRKRILVIHFSEKQRKSVVFWRDLVNVTVRREMGSDIDAACGQLRNNFMEQTNSD